MRRLRLRYAATCSVCGIALSPRTEAYWDGDAKRATCMAVLYPEALRDRLKKNGDLARETMERVANRLALSLPLARR